MYIKRIKMSFNLITLNMLCRKLKIKNYKKKESFFKRTKKKVNYSFKMKGVSKRFTHFS